MAYTPFLPDTPDITDDGDVVINNTRENLMALRDAIVNGALVDWDLATADITGPADEPTQLVYKKSTEWMKLVITWGTSGGDDGNPLTVVYSYSANSGGLYDAIGTLTNTYDSSGNLRSALWT